MQKKYLEIKDYLMERIRSGEYKPEPGDPGGTGTGCPAGCKPYDRAQGHRRTDV